ncbi:hypothetical protein RUM44_001094 [Polyplax serrata]|uniref:ER-bound oxygenase mpaB/mpaB'/Rubber oxygenase catalytic domain-containing protein n=1 Tax=Polyplax serrata TaxID=468196 RepID=A0ABR1B6N9_POLSC
MQTVTRRITQQHTNDVDEQIRLLKEDADEPNLLHGNAMGELPEWFDKEKFRRGQQFFNANYYALFVSKLCGLFVILAIPRVLKILTMTRKSSTPSTAFKRYMSTLGHMLTWYNEDITDKESGAYKSLKAVYAKHSMANKRGLSEKNGSVSQSSLAITQFGFMGFGLLMQDKLGISVRDPKDLEGFIHFWRTIGHMIGIEDRYNICRGTVEETKETCRRVLKEILWPVLKSPSQEFREMTSALLKGMWAMIIFLDVEGFTAFTYELTGLEINKFTNWWSKAVYNFQKITHKILCSSIIGHFLRIFLNYELWLTVEISLRYPILAYLKFGMPNKSTLETP